ncbi:hypothetical protein [Cytobacillus sp. IB215665]|nr:hypothetical protein [Cytobacillus sp. IB215665]MDX8366322.1 hypothetical protein [Cytobacillus sp. IB215665]
MKYTLIFTCIIITTFVYGCSSEQSAIIASLEKQVNDLETQNEQEKPV